MGLGQGMEVDDSVCGRHELMCPNEKGDKSFGFYRQRSGMADCDKFD